MKCFNCSCQVSSDFKYAFSTNCCPKCGDFLMPVNVKSLYTKMQDFLSKDGHDIGDLAVWLTESYLPVAVKTGQLIQEADDSIQEDTSEVSLEEEFSKTNLLENEDSAIVTRKPIKPTKTAKETKLLDQNRTNLFAKRAGVDKIKYETLVKDIQGAGTVIETDEDTEDYSQDYENSDEDFSENPLSRREMQQVAGLFEGGDSGKMDFSEIEKLHKLEQLSSTGSVGMIRRSS